jgi:hypothetical protein
MLFIMKKYLNQIMNKALISKIKKWKIIIYKIILSQTANLLFSTDSMNY